MSDDTTTWREFAPWAFVIVGVLVLFWFAFADEDPPGDAEVYERIEATTSCAELQETFDRNMDDAERREPNTPLRDVVMSYAEAADDRMEEIGCYD